MQHYNQIHNMCLKNRQCDLHTFNQSTIEVTLHVFFVIQVKIKVLRVFQVCTNAHLFTFKIHNVAWNIWIIKVCVGNLSSLLIQGKLDWTFTITKVYSFPMRVLLKLVKVKVFSLLSKHYLMAIQWNVFQCFNNIRMI